MIGGKMTEVTDPALLVEAGVVYQVYPHPFKDS